MDSGNIGALIAQGKIVKIADIDPNNDYIQIGKFQTGNRKNSSANADAYAPYVIPLSLVLGGGSTYTGSNGIVLIGNDFQLASNNISQFTNDSGYLTAATVKAAAWTPDGNGFASEKFLGTLNNFALPFRVNNNEVARFTTDPAGSTRLYINANTNLYGSNAGIQYNSDGTSPNRAQLRLNTHGNNIGAPGITGFKSRGLTIGSTLSVLPGDNLFRITSIGVSGNDTSMNLASLIDVRVASVLPGYVATDFVVALNSLAGVMTERFYVTSEGNVGIGTSVPAARVHIVGSGNTTATIGVQSVSANTQNWFRAYDDGTIWSQGAANNAHLFASYVGNVSATYDSPGIQFLEFKIGGVIKSQLINQAALTRFNQAAGQFWGVYGSDNNPYILFDETNKNVGIGTSTPVQKLDVVGNINVGLTDGYYLNNLKFLSGNGFNSDSIQLGRGANGTAAAGDQYIAMGIFSYATESGIAIGYSSTINNGTFDGIAIGRAAVVDAGLIRGVALGRNANAKHNNAWAIGFNAVTTQDNEFNFGVVGTESKLIVNGSVGVSVANPTARLHVQGDSANSASHVLKLNNLASAPILYARNDGKVSIGVAAPLAKFHVESVADGGALFVINDGLFDVNLSGSLGQLRFTYGLNEFMINPYPTALSTPFRFKSNPAGTTGESGIEHIVTANITSTVGGGSLIGEVLEMGSIGIQTGTIRGKVIRKLNFNNPNATFYPFIALDGNSGFGTFTPTATIHGKGVSVLSTDFVMKLDNSANSTILHARNDGSINTPLIPTSGTGSPPGGTVSGDLWVDTSGGGNPIVCRVP